MSDELEKKYESLMPDFLQFKSINRVNHKPHVFVIGHRHVVHAADHHGGSLNESAIKGAEARGIFCAERGCQVPYSEHTSDHVLFLALKRDVNKDEMQKWAKGIAPDLEGDKIDGMAFVETKDEFRFVGPETGG